MPNSREATTKIESIVEITEDDETAKLYIAIPHVQSHVSPHATLLEKKNGLGIHLYKRPIRRSDRSRAKIIIVIGGTGAGKTTLLNTLVTYCLGVAREDDFRYTIVDERGKDPTKSVTSEVSEYFIEETDRNPPLLIIDTPGFGDTKGVSSDNAIFELIKA